MCFIITKSSKYKIIIYITKCKSKILIQRYLIIYTR